MTRADGRCPICGNWEDIEESGGVFYPESDQVEYECKCPHCDIQWTTVCGLKYKGFQIGNTWVGDEGEITVIH